MTASVEDINGPRSRTSAPGSTALHRLTTSAVCNSIEPARPGSATAGSSWSAAAVCPVANGRYPSEAKHREAGPASSFDTRMSRSRMTRSAGSGHQPAIRACNPFSGTATMPAEARSFEDHPALITQVGHAEAGWRRTPAAGRSGGWVDPGAKCATTWASASAGRAVHQPRSRPALHRAGSRSWAAARRRAPSHRSSGGRAARPGVDRSAEDKTRRSVTSNSPMKIAHAH